MPEVGNKDESIVRYEVGSLGHQILGEEIALENSREYPPPPPNYTSSVLKNFILVLVAEE